MGSGLEMAAFCGWVEAHDDSVFGLPELGLGLIPGAGGTVSVTRRIGRWRTAYLVLSGAAIGADTALCLGAGGRELRWRLRPRSEARIRGGGRGREGETIAENIANDRMTYTITYAANAAPTIAPMMAHFFALSAAAWASAYRPWDHSPETLVEYTIETIPNGRQHSTVTRIAQTR